ncbi:unnamed protein product [Effrenium voratum]|nr:unnamed protein product [Effrenium voratum]
MGILQRIAVVFVIVAAIELYVPANVRSRSEPLLRTESAGLGFWLLPATAFRWAVALAVAACGAVLTYALRPPATWPGCSPAAALRGNADPEALHRMGCSSVGWLDSLILGVDHVYIRGSNQGLPANFGFDPEGLVTTLSAIFCMFLGLHLGRVWLILAKPRPVISHWLILGALCASLGAALSFGLPFNKRLWSPSYSLFTAGTGTVLYSGLFAACDAAPSSRAAAVFGTALAPFQWLGSNCILFFVFSECCGVLSWLLRVVSWGQPASEHNIVHWFHDQFLWQTCSLGAGCKSGALCGPVEVAYTVVGLVFWVLVCGILHRKQIFWKI